MALFFAVLLFSNAIIMLQNAQELIKQAQFPKEIKDADIKKAVHGTAIFMLLFSLSIIANVILNIRFLKWYFTNLSKNENE